MASSLSTVRAFCVQAPGRTPTMLMIVGTTIAPPASHGSTVGGHPISAAAYPANVIATAAIAPVAITSSSAQAYRNPTSGPNASRR